jgi:hypothetical protein
MNQNLISNVDMIHDCLNKLYAKRENLLDLWDAPIYDALPQGEATNEYDALSDHIHFLVATLHKLDSIIKTAIKYLQDEGLND